jgi:hypothetical protein
MMQAREPELPEGVDARLWFEMHGCEGLHYLVEGNPHTSRGRMSAWCPARNRFTTVSKLEIRTSSPEAGWFVQGYLSGMEPPPEGDPGRWRRAAALFRRTGLWRTATGMRCPRCDAELLPSELMPDPGRPFSACAR